MERKKSVFIASVSASVLLVSSLLVACATAEATGPGMSAPASGTLQAESESAARASSSASQSSTTSPASSTPAPSSVPASSQAPAGQAPVCTPQEAAPQVPASSSECAPVPAPTPPPEPAPAPAPSVDIGGCLAAAGWASGNNMAVNDGLYIGGAGYENPIDTTGKTDAQVTEHLLYQLGLIHSQLAAMPEYDPATVYPCYKFVVDGSMIYVLYG